MNEPEDTHEYRFEVGQIVQFDAELGYTMAHEFYLIVDRWLKFESRAERYVERYQLQALNPHPGFENDLLLASAWQIEIAREL